jgi:hypothetical protein
MRTTLGKWKTHEVKVRGVEQIVVYVGDWATHRGIASLFPGTESVDVTRANARLIAAAPDLLNALQAICNAPSADNWTIPADLMSNAHAAIVKATLDPVAAHDLELADDLDEVRP